MTKAELIHTDPNIDQARKAFFDWLEKNRPWVTAGQDAYGMMAEIVDQAALAFRGDWRPSLQEWQEREAEVLKLTESMDEHPEGYEGPCLCGMCREAGR